MRLDLGCLMMQLLSFDGGVTFGWQAYCEVIEVVVLALTGSHSIEVLLIIEKQLVDYAEHLVASLTTVPLDPRLV